MRIALVTGATGCIGRALTRQLLDAGVHTRVLVRNPAAFHRLFPDGTAEVICGDLSDSKVLERAVAGVDTVFHAAAKVHTRPRNAREERTFFEVNVDDTQRLLRACTSAPVASFVFFSTIAVFGPRPSLLNEQTPCAPQTVYGISKYKAEQVVATHFAGSGVKPTIFRLSMVFGEGDRGNFMRMVRAIDRGHFVNAGADVQKSLAYAPNVGTAAILAASDKEARGEVFIMADPQPYSTRELAARIAQLLGKPKPRVYIPAWPLRKAGKIFRVAHNSLGVPVPFTDTDIESLTCRTICDTSKLREKLGYRPAITLEEGFSRTVAWYRSQQRR